MLFIICLCECHVNTLVFVKMTKGMTLRSQTKEVVPNVYDCLEELNKCKRTQKSLKRTADATLVSCTSMKRLLIVLMTNSSSHSQSSFFVKRFFQNHGGYIASCLKFQKTILDYYFNNNNCYNGHLFI